MHVDQMKTFWLGLFLVGTITWVIAFDVTETFDVRYRAAVYEHAVVLPLPPASTRQGALGQMEKNLDVYRKQAASAKQRGAQLIVFPEDGLYGMLLSRDQIRPFLETVPDPRASHVTPCVEQVPHTEVQTALSCLARDLGIYLVANMGDRHGVRDLAFPTAWMDAPPLLPAVGFHSGFARGLGVTVLAANLHLPLANMHGSGVYTARGATAFYYDSELTSPGRLVVADVLQDGTARMVFPEDWSGPRPDLPGRQPDSPDALPDFQDLLSNSPDRHPHSLGRQPDFSDREHDVLSRNYDFSETDHGAKVSKSDPRTRFVTGSAETFDQAGENSKSGSSLRYASMHKQNTSIKETLITKLLRKVSSASHKSSASLKNLRQAGREGMSIAQKVIQETKNSQRRRRTFHFERNTRNRELNARKERVWKADYLHKIMPFATSRKEPVYLSDNFTFVQLNLTSGQKELCFQEFCCSVQYKFAETIKRTPIPDLTSSSTVHKLSRDSRPNLPSHSKESNLSAHKLKGSSPLLWSATLAKNKPKGSEKENQESVHSINLDPKSHEPSDIQTRKPADHDLGEDGEELYALGVFSGFEGDIGTQRFVQVCLVTRCPKGTLDSCGQPVTMATRRMETLRLQGHFSTRHVFPEVLVIQEGQLSPAPGLWDYSAGTIVGGATLSDSPLVAAALYGRWYERDHPPVP